MRLLCHVFAVATRAVRVKVIHPAANVAAIVIAIHNAVNITARHCVRGQSRLCMCSWTFVFLARQNISGISHAIRLLATSLIHKARKVYWRFYLPQPIEIPSSKWEEWHRWRFALAQWCYHRQWSICHFGSVRDCQFGECCFEYASISIYVYCVWYFVETWPYFGGTRKYFPVIVGTEKDAHFETAHALPGIDEKFIVLFLTNDKKKKTKNRLKGKRALDSPE